MPHLDIHRSHGHISPIVERFAGATSETNRRRANLSAQRCIDPAERRTMIARSFPFMEDAF
jgi:hypothetical protein